MRRTESQCYVVIENFKELPDSSFAAIQGAAAKLSENPKTRTVHEILPGLGTVLRIVPEEELWAAIGVISGKW